MWEAIVTAYSRPGDRVRVSDAGDGTVVRVALNAERKITVSAPVSSSWQGASLRFTVLDPLPPQVRDRATLLTAAWTTPSPEGQDDLLIVTPPCPGDQPGDDDAAGAGGKKDRRPPGTPDDTVLAYQLQALTRGAALVRPGGVVAVLTRISPDPDGAVDRIGPLVAHARTLGLRYLQHNPLIHAVVTAGRIKAQFGPDDPYWHLPHTDDAASPGASLEPSALEYDGSAAVAVTALHLPVHSDLIVFTQATDTASDAQPGGAQ